MTTTLARIKAHARTLSRRTLEHWLNKSALAAQEKERD
jgi:hypothetical protein